MTEQVASSKNPRRYQVVEKTEVELGRASLFKQARTIIRLAKSVEADALVNSIVPQLESDYNKRVLRGELPEDTIADLLTKVGKRLA